MDRVFRGQQIGEVFAPLSGHNGTLIQIIVKTGGTQVVLGGDAVEVEVGQRAGAAVIVDDGKGGAADRVGAAQPRGQALTKGGLARAQTAGEGDQGPVRQHCRQLPAQRNGLFSGMCNIFSHTMLLYLEA